MKLFAHQETGIEYLKKHRYVLLADSMGLGKSLQAILAMEATPGKRLVVVPAYLRDTWVAEIERFSTMVPAIVKGFGYDDWSTPDVFICSYEGMKFIPSYLNLTSIVFDESQKIVNPKAKRTNLAHDLIGRQKPRNLYLLSGTPITKDVGQFYAPLVLLSMCPARSNGQHLPGKTSHFDFQKAFSNMGTRRINTPSGPRNITEFTGVRNLLELKRLFQDKYLRRTAEEVLDLPEISSKEIILPEDKSSRELEQAWKDHEANTGTPAHIATCKKESAVSKAKATTSYALDILENGEQVVIFSDHVDPVIKIAKGLSDKGITVGHIIGSVKPEDRAKLVARFQAGLLEALVCTIPAASTGITLTAARHLIFNDLSWSSTDNQQAAARIHRIGQERKSFLHFILRGKIDRQIKRKVIQKATLLKEVL